MHRPIKTTLLYKRPVVYKMYEMGVMLIVKGVNEY